MKRFILLSALLGYSGGTFYFARFWYQVGTGNAYRRSVMNGVEVQTIIGTGIYKFGYIISALNVFAFSLSLLFYLIISYIYLSKDTSDNVKKKLKILYITIMVISANCIAYSQSLISDSSSYTQLVIPGFIISGIIAALIAIPSIIIYYRRKKRNTDTRIKREY